VTTPFTFLAPGKPGHTGLGLPAFETQALLQTDVFKELINKLAWALGSTYRTQYGNTRTPTRQLAIALASHLVRTQGYPSKIALEPKA